MILWCFGGIMFLGVSLNAWCTWTLTIVCIAVAVGREELPASDSDVYRRTIISNREAENTDKSACPSDDLSCLKDPFGYDAVKQLHAQIDDDQNGNVDRDESNGFLRDDLKLEDDLTQRADLHSTDDLISVQDLWKLWSDSDAYHWSVDEVIDWLTVHVELPQYAINFRINEVDGHMLPRLTSFSSHSLLSIIGIKNPVHRQKLALKAADVVLFGPPKYGHSIVKDFALVTSLFIAVSGCYFAYFQHRKSQHHLQKVMKDLRALQKAEDALSQLQLQLKKAQTEQQVVISAKHDVEKKLKMEIETSKAEAERLRLQREMLAKEQVSCFKLAEDELAQLRKALNEAERQLQNHTPLISNDLQQWLQLTYEVETKYFEAKRRETEQQLKDAREMCDKIRRQKDKFFGSFHVAHTNSLDDADDKIMQVRRAMEDVKKVLQERSFRWKEIESICGFNIIINPGIPYLNSLLRRSRFVPCSTSSYQDMKRRSSFLAIDGLQEGVSVAYPPQSCTSQQVLSNLMKAGMQLSLVGVNLSGMNSSRVSQRDCDPSPISLPLCQCESIHSLPSLGSLSSMQRYGSHCSSVAAAGRSYLAPTVNLEADESAKKKSTSNGFLCEGQDGSFPAPPVDSEAEDSAKAMPNSNGYLCESHDNLWDSHVKSLEDNVVPSFALPSQGTEVTESAKDLIDELEMDKTLLAEMLEQVTSRSAKQKSKQSKKKLTFSKLLKGSVTNKEKSS